MMVVREGLIEKVNLNRALKNVRGSPTSCTRGERSALLRRFALTVEQRSGAVDGAAHREKRAFYLD